MTKQRLPPTLPCKLTDREDTGTWRDLKMREEYILKKLSDFLKRTRFLFRVLVSRVNPSLSWPSIGPGAPACLSAPLPLAYSKACWLISPLDKPSDILKTLSGMQRFRKLPFPALPSTMLFENILQQNPRKRERTDSQNTGMNPGVQWIEMPEVHKTISQN